jgi:hypothetical protein
MRLVILDEIDNQNWRPGPKTYAIKGDESVCLGNPSAHERLTWIAKGYEIRVMSLSEKIELMRERTGFYRKRVAP